MIGALFTLLIYLLICGVLWWAITQALAAFPLPAPLSQLIRVVLVVIFAIIVIGLLLDLLGVGTGLNMPRIR